MKWRRALSHHSCPSQMHCCCGNCGIRAVTQIQHLRCMCCCGSWLYCCCFIQERTRNPQDLHNCLHNTVRCEKFWLVRALSTRGDLLRMFLECQASFGLNNSFVNQPLPSHIHMAPYVRWCMLSDPVFISLKRSIHEHFSPIYRRRSTRRRSSRSWTGSARVRSARCSRASTSARKPWWPSRSSTWRRRRTRSRTFSRKSWCYLSATVPTLPSTTVHTWRCVTFRRIVLSRECHHQWDPPCHHHPSVVQHSVTPHCSAGLRVGSVLQAVLLVQTT